MAKQDSRIAKLYARALFEELSPDEWDAAATSLEEMKSELSQSRDLRDALKHPGVSQAEQIAVIREFTALFSNDEKLANFAALLAANRRLGELDAICEAFAECVAAARREVHFLVESAFELSAAEQSDFRSTLSADFGGSVIVDFSVNPDLIGGLRVTQGDLVLDHSVRGRLTRLRETLVGE